MDVIINPPGFEKKYIEYLNQSFGDWGDEPLYNWCFDRKVGGPKPDLMILKNKNQVLAGSGVSYRKVTLDNSNSVLVGIMTGSWTLPEARGHGCFTQIITESMELCRRQDADYLLAFVTESNASSRRLVSAGAETSPTHYLFSTEASLSGAPELNYRIQSEINSIAPSMFERFSERLPNTSHLIYDYKSWKSQFLARPKPVQTLIIDDGFAIFEVGKDVIRILAMVVGKKAPAISYLDATVAYAAKIDRRVFMFTTTSIWRDICITRGFENVPGLLTIFPTKTTDTLKTDLGLWDIQSGDRM
jgi:hypothetical protein